MINDHGLSAHLMRGREGNNLFLGMLAARFLGNLDPFKVQLEIILTSEYFPKLYK